MRTLRVEEWHALGVYSHFLLSQVNVTHQRNTLVCWLTLRL